MNALAASAHSNEFRVRSQITTASRQLVASAFVTPILAEFRESLTKGGPFGRTTAEDRLGPIVDGHVADAMVRRADFSITRAVERSMLRRVGLQPLGPAAPSQGRGRLVEVTA